MSEKPLLLSGAKLGVLPRTDSSRSLSYLAVLGIGLLTVAVGGADVSTRLVNLAGEGARYQAFAPAIVRTNPPPFSSTPLVPTRIAIPAIGVDALVEQVGVRDDGTMANPSSFATTGWYKFGAKPGGAGNAVIAGHVNNALGLSGVFANLSDLRIGDPVFVSDSERTLKYVVKSKTQYATERAPLEEIFSITGPSQLVLITCEGDWDRESRSYDKRLVVVATLVP